MYVCIYVNPKYMTPPINAASASEKTQKDLVREGLGNSFTIHVMCYKMQGNHVVCNEVPSGTVSPNPNPSPKPNPENKKGKKL